MAIIGLRKLCDPAFVYLFISMIALITIALQQNMYNPNMYYLGIYSTEVSSVYLIFVIKLIYVLFWTWILNIICRYVSTPIAWFLVLLPFIILFILITLLFLSV